ncbi:MAG TPA: hypothetical protein VLZ83_06020 [Edaphocola sp.]|nr:hypothetical protein [Edaphocola sp.]
MKKLLLVFISALFFLSCKNSNDSLNLNNGEKWEINEEMRPFINTGSEMVNGFLDAEHGDYRILAYDLKTHNDELVKSCTMKGQSHDELHKWLLPHLELVAKLESVKDDKEAKKIVKELQESYQRFDKNFK